MRLLVALVLLLGLTAAVEPRASLPDIEDEVMCVECRTALNVSSAPVADQERAFIRERIAEGMTKQQIKAALVEEYGPDVLAEPGDDGFDLAAWLVPAGAIGLAAMAIFFGLRRWRRDEGRVEDQDPAAIDDEDRERLDRDLARYDL